MKAIILGKPIVRIFFRILSVELQRVSHKGTILFPAKADFSFESFSTIEGRECLYFQPRFGRRAVALKLLYIMYKKLFNRGHNKQ